MSQSRSPEHLDAAEPAPVVGFGKGHSGSLAGIPASRTRTGAGTRSQRADSDSAPARSVWEIIGQADGGLSVLRTFRLLRVLKLVRFMPALRRQLVVLVKTMDNVATFCMLLMLFIFIFR